MMIMSTWSASPAASAALQPLWDLDAAQSIHNKSAMQSLCLSALTTAAAHGAHQHGEASSKTCCRLEPLSFDLGRAPGANNQAGVRVVDGEQEAVAAAQERQPPQIRPIPIHAEQAVRHHQLPLAWAAEQFGQFVRWAPKQMQCGPHFFSFPTEKLRAHMYSCSTGSALHNCKLSLECCTHFAAMSVTAHLLMPSPKMNFDLI